MTQKTKNILLLVVLFLLGIAAYEFSISQTLNLQDEISEINKLVKNSEDLKQQNNLLTIRESFLDSVVSKSFHGNQESAIQNNLLNVLGQHSKDNKMIDNFKEPHVFSDQDNNVTESFSFGLTGNYNEIEDLIYTLENKYGFGKIKHLNFEKIKNFRTSETRLYVTAILQHSR